MGSGWDEVEVVINGSMVPNPLAGHGSCLTNHFYTVIREGRE